MQSIVQWLEDLGLGQYADAFVEANIEPRLLPELSESDFEKLGVTLGHRKQLARAIAGLAAPAAGGPEAGPRGVAEAERRQLTVMFWDLVGSTALSAQLDPEDLRAVIGAYHRACTEVIGRAGGFVAQFMGDGALAYFGYPQAHEDDAERAVLAGLELVHAVEEVDVRTPLRARVGIATGLVVVGDLFGEGAAQRRAVVGETPNLAARLQGLAEPGTVVIAAGTRRLLGRLFDYRALDPARSRASPSPSRPGRCCTRAPRKAGSRRGRNAGCCRWSGGRRSWSCSCAAGAARRRARARWSCSAARRASASRASCGRCRTGWRRSPSRTPRCAISARRIIRTARSIRSSSGSSTKPGSRATTSPEVRRGKLEALLAAAAAPEEEVALLAALLSLPAGERDQLAAMSPAAAQGEDAGRAARAASSGWRRESRC